MSANFLLTKRFGGSMILFRWWFCYSAIGIGILNATGVFYKDIGYEKNHRIRTCADHIISHFHVISMGDQDYIHVENFHDCAHKEGICRVRFFAFENE